MKYNLSFFDPGFSRSVLRVLIAICGLAKLADAVGIPYTFSHEGNNYALNTTATGDSNKEAIAKGFYQAVGTLIENGTACGTVMAPTANVTEYVVAWFLQHFGSHNMTLLRDASQPAHESFEACTYDQALNASGPFVHQFKDLQDGTAWGGVVIAVFLTLLAACTVGIGINCIAKCAQSNDDGPSRQQYNAI